MIFGGNSNFWDCENVYFQETFDSEHIEKIRLNVSSAYEVFKGKTLDTDGVGKVGSNFWMVD